jgi:hypothetical protein
MGSRAGTMFDPTFIQEHFETPAQYAQSVKAYLLGQKQLPQALRQYLTNLS